MCCVSLPGNRHPARRARGCLLSTLGRSSPCSGAARDRPVWAGQHRLPGPPHSFSCSSYLLGRVCLFSGLQPAAVCQRGTMPCASRWPEQRAGASGRSRGPRARGQDTKANGRARLGTAWLCFCCSLIFGGRTRSLSIESNNNNSGFKQLSSGP